MGRPTRHRPRRLATTAALVAPLILAGCRADPNYEPLTMGELGDTLLGAGAFAGTAAAIGGLQNAGGGRGVRYLSSEPREWDRD